MERHPIGAEVLAAPAERFEFVPDARRLRESLERLTTAWRPLEPAAARRARTLAMEILARSSDPRLSDRGPIRFEITVLERIVRIEASGPGLLAPSRPGRLDREAERLFPEWAIHDLADRWGVDDDRPAAVWFEVDRHRTERLAA